MPNDRPSDLPVLSTLDHDRDVVGMRYVYPVVSRRSGGVSIGINLNPNNACNWHCAYCQVSGLTRGHAPEIDTDRLERELSTMLTSVVYGSFMRQSVPEGCRILTDIAISGNGEPTSSIQFVAVIDLIGRVMAAFGLKGKIPLVLITNGSYLAKPRVQEGIGKIAGLGGEVWFKVDAVTPATSQKVNGVTLRAKRLRDNLGMCVRQCPTWIQSCQFAWDGVAPSEEILAAYVGFLGGVKRRRIAIKGVRLYGIARIPRQAESVHVSRLDDADMQAIAARIEGLGIPVIVTP